MTDPLTQSETLQTESIRELVQSPLFEAAYEQEDITFPLATFDPLSDENPEWADVRLSDELKECALRFVSLSCEWSLASRDRNLDGEFSLPHLYLAITRDPPRHNDLATESERALLADLRMIDSAPRRATGEAAFIRLEPHKETLEIWYQDRYLFDEQNNTQGFLKMELSYCDYLDTLRLTKGAFGWQMLFVDASLRGSGFRAHVENLTNMLETFPAAFPQYDYTALVNRLEARQ
ncbi:hypothetical protein OHB35_40110 [Streptomyces phaeochromogenes]|uniref:Uncharacterized protein n=1 Tax=Streptomyces phaeochromogenes TaxID=1923 RepID=A0ABZ1HNK1_STRPH|nr:hypothetical protein [Streptomyces phaeochromogenes]WSD18951.1 hypothetical protein OHB35_40110 [Streptomyces phaeochromogenes]